MINEAAIAKDAAVARLNKVQLLVQYIPSRRLRSRGSVISSSNKRNFGLKYSLSVRYLNLQISHLQRIWKPVDYDNRFSIIESTLPSTLTPLIIESSFVVTICVS